MIDFDTKLAGILIPVFALRRQDDLGIGDTKAVLDAIDFCARNNAAVLQVLPINETGGDNSPYNAISSIALDPVLLAMVTDMVPGLTPDMLKKLAPDEVASELRQGSVNYAGVKKLKLDLLKEAFAKFSKDDLAAKKLGPKAKEFRQFEKEQNDWLPAYTLFRTLVEINGGNASWTQWPAEQQTPQKAEAWLKSSAPDPDKLSNMREFFSYVQWVAFSQWRAVHQHADEHGVALMGDIPFGVSRYSADVWANQELFDLDWSGGAPPEIWFQEDEFTSKWGQNWGLPLYRWEKHHQSKFSWWRQRVQKCTEIFHYFRIDHVLGFFRIYSFPWLPERNAEFLPLTEAEAKKVTGGRLPCFQPRSDEKPEWAASNAKEGQALLEIVLNAAGDAGVVAEDLGGAIPEYVRPTLQELQIPGFTIPYWEKDAEQELKAKEDLPSINLATYATHDHQPLVVFYEELVKRWHGADGHAAWLDVQRLMRWLDLDDEHPPTHFTPQLHAAFMRALLETPCWLAIFMITDLLGTKERFNQPGTSGESNWSRRLDQPLDFYEKNAPFQNRIADFRKLVRDTGRLRLLAAAQAGTIN